METELIKACCSEYEQLVKAQFGSAKSLVDLETCHQKFKAKILASLPIKWKDLSGSSKVPLKLVSTLDDKLEELNASFKTRFETGKKAESASANQIRLQAVQLYKAEMDKYLSKHAMASPKEILLKHQEKAQAIITQINEKFKDALKARTVIDLRMDMDSCHEYYQNRAKLNLSALLDPAIGIDLGTTNCCVMIYHKGEVQLIKNPYDGKNTIPSYVAFHPSGTDTFGREAKDAAYRFPEVTIYDAKRMIGRSWYDENLQKDRVNWPFEVENDNDNPKISTGNGFRYPHEISARLLARFRHITEEQLKLAPGTIRKAVITVPAYFTEPQRRATEQAAKCAGLQVLNILSEPTAAAIAYNYNQLQENCRKTVLIYDLGGGTFDVAIAEVKPHSVNILAVDGDCHLGGQDFDQLLMQHSLDQFRNLHNLDIQAERDSKDRSTRNEARSALCRLKLQCELAKESLSTAQKTSIEVDQIFKGKDLAISVSRNLMENLVENLVTKTIEIVKRAIHQAKIEMNRDHLEIQEIILVGGVTRMPLVQQEISKHFHGVKICKSINPDEAVAYGAAIQAAILTSAKDVKEIKVDDVIPLSIGIKTMKDTFTVVIPRNSKLPCEKTKVFGTTEDNQMSTVVSVYQGENGFCKENKWLGEFVFRGFLPRKAGEEKLQVKMMVDSMGILQVEAESLSTNKRNTITVETERLGMDKAAVQRLTTECARLNLQ